MVSLVSINICYHVYDKDSISVKLSLDLWSKKKRERVMLYCFRSHSEGAYLLISNLSQMAADKFETLDLHFLTQKLKNSKCPPQRPPTWRT